MTTVKPPKNWHNAPRVGDPVSAEELPETLARLFWNYLQDYIKDNGHHLPSKNFKGIVSSETFNKIAMSCRHGDADPSPFGFAPAFSPPSEDEAPGRFMTVFGYRFDIVDFHDPNVKRLVRDSGRMLFELPEGDTP